MDPRPRGVSTTTSHSAGRGQTDLSPPIVAQPGEGELPDAAVRLQGLTDRGAARAPEIVAPEAEPLLAALSTVRGIYIFSAQADPPLPPWVRNTVLRKQLQRRMPLTPHRYSKKRDSRCAHFRGFGSTHSAQLPKVGTMGELRELGADRSQKSNFLTV